MDLLDLVTELEVDAPAANAASPLRLLSIGKYLQLAQGQRVVDFGCGRGEMLCLWAKHFGTYGVGIDLDAGFLADARSRAKRWRIADKVRFVRLDAKDYEKGEAVFDVAACMGATMSFGGFAPTLRHLKSVVGTGGALVVAEAFFTEQEVREELREYEGDLHTEPELFAIARSEGLEVGYYSRASRDEWCHYIFANRRRELKELSKLPPGVEREERRARLHRWQDIYVRYKQSWQEMGFLTLHPV